MPFPTRPFPSATVRRDAHKICNLSFAISLPHVLKVYSVRPQSEAAREASAQLTVKRGRDVSLELVL